MHKSFGQVHSNPNYSEPVRGQCPNCKQFSPLASGKCYWCDEDVDELDQEAIANQSHSLWLDVHAENFPAVELYKKSGFTEIYQRKGYYQTPTGDAVLMKKTLHEVAAKRSDED